MAAMLFPEYNRINVTNFYPLLPPPPPRDAGAVEGALIVGALCLAGALMLGELLLAGALLLFAGADRCTGALYSTFLAGAGALRSIFRAGAGVLLSILAGCAFSVLVYDGVFLTALLLLLAGVSAVLTVCVPWAPLTGAVSLVLTAFPFLRTVLMFELFTVLPLDEFVNEFLGESVPRVARVFALFCSSAYLLLTLLFLLVKEVLGCCLS